MATQTPIPIYSQKETFYVPHFEVRVRGEKLKSNVVDDILQVTYKDNINEIDSFTIEINNWDAEKRTFKFAPSLREYAGIFDPGAPIEIYMGYQNNLRRMMRGTVTSLEPVFSESSAPTLTVGGKNELHELLTEQHTKSWEKTKDTDIAKEICKLPRKKGQAGLGLPIDTNPSPTEPAEEFVSMTSQFDIVFLLERARRRGYEMYLKDRDKDGKPTLYFGLSENKADAPVYRLEWGKSLISFRPRLSTSKQISTVEVRGWDRKANKEIDVKYTLQDLWKDQKKSKTEVDRLSQIAKAYGEKSDVVTDRPVRDANEARELAKSILGDQSKKLIEASGATLGLPDLRAGVALEVVGFGARTDQKGNVVGAGSDFDGEYFVTDSTHTIGSGGFRTEFSARREGPLPDESQRGNRT